MLVNNDKLWYTVVYCIVWSKRVVKKLSSWKICFGLVSLLKNSRESEKPNFFKWKSSVVEEEGPTRVKISGKSMKHIHSISISISERRARENSKAIYVRLRIVVKIGYVHGWFRHDGKSWKDVCEIVKTRLCKSIFSPKAILHGFYMFRASTPFWRPDARAIQSA